MKLASSLECTACMACVDSCGHDALSVEIDETGFFRIAIDKEKCVECGLCTKICPIINKPYKPKEFTPIPNAAWSLDNQLRLRSASGGAFAALAAIFLNDEGVVYGAVIDGFKVKHMRVTSLNELPLILGSKYQHSDMRGIYRQVKKDLLEGKKVLFSGLSCQCAGVFKYVGKKNTDNLFLVDTICGGVSTMLPILSLEKSGKYNRIISFRDKENGWKSKGYSYSLKLEYKDGSVCDLGADNLVLKCFNSKIAKRASCLDCQFNGVSRISDCTIGDFWGDSDFGSEHYKGLSVLVQNTERIRRYIEKSTLQTHIITWEKLVQSNPSYYWTHCSYLRYCVLRRKLNKYLISNNLAKVEDLLDSHKFADIIDIKFYFIYNEIRRKKALKQLLEMDK